MAIALPHPSSAARSIVADVIAHEGPGYRNLADNVRAGGEPNLWIRFALGAAETALRVPRGDD